MRDDDKSPSTFTPPASSLIELFDSICFHHGEKDAIIGPPHSFRPVCYHELQYASQALAAQLLHRYRPTYVLLDLRNVAAAEAVAVLACTRIGVPFVPVSAEEYHVGGRLKAIVKALQQHSQKRDTCTEESIRIVAVVRCDNDKDPILTRFAQANVYNAVYVNDSGDMLEPMDVPQSLPAFPTSSSQLNDDLYVLFTSGTSGKEPKGVVGSHKSTLHRLSWFAKTFPSRENTVIARRSKLTFVDSITEMFSALLFPPAVLYAFDAKDLSSKGVSVILEAVPCCTRVTMLPSQLSQLLLTLDAENNRQKQHYSMEMVIVSGEPCPPSLLAKFQKHFPSTQLINLYGQTESTGDVTCAVLTEMKHPVIDNVVSVGRPIDGVRITANGRNELIVEGNLSNGYLHRQFTQFATGDIGFCRDGSWYVQGRVDDVIKVNGVLTSPSEVEAAFAKIYPSAMAVAVTISDAVYIAIESSSQVDFSREAMREAGIPWNLIPRRVFPVAAIPKSSGGAGKVDRARVKRLVESFLAPDVERNGKDKFFSLVSQVLGVTLSDDVWALSSFVELGGDSALAVTLLYKLKVNGFVGSDAFTARDILETDSIQQLKAILTSNAPIKKQKKKSPNMQEQRPFLPKEVKRISSGHVAVEFAACVDAPPLVHSGVLYGACQGGIIQKIQGEQICAHHDLGWSIQAGMLVVNDALVVCGYDADNDSGIVTFVDLDLKSPKWTRKFKGTIKSTPVAVDGYLYVVSGTTLHVMNITSDDPCEEHSLELPSTTESRPAIVARDGASCLVYAFSDWDVGLAIVEKGGSKMTNILRDAIPSPVYADPLVVGDRVLVCDISGYLHCFDIECPETVESTKVSTKPIFSGPVVIDDDVVVFGCHDGIVRCVNISNFSEIKWQYNGKAVIYSTICVLSKGVLIVCTTAGDILRLKDGELKWKCTVDGEIWSSPIVFEDRVIVGARDSKLHIIPIQES